MNLRRIPAFVLALGAFASLAWGTDPATVAEVAWEGERVRNQVARMTPGEDWVDQVVSPGEVGLDSCEPFSLELDPDTLETLVVDDEDEVCCGVYTGIGRADSSRVVLWVEPDAGFFPEPPAGRDQTSAPRRGAETNFFISGFEKLQSGCFLVTVTNGGTNAETEIFAFTMTADLYSVTNIWTNDANVVTTLVSTVYSNWSPSLAGFSSAWTRVAAHVPLTDGVGTWTDTSVLPTTPVRFYAAALRQDSDGDGLTDGEELFVWHSDTDNRDSDGDGWDDGEEVSSGCDLLDGDSTPGVTDGVEVSWTATRPGWEPGRSIWRDGIVCFEVTATNGAGIWATFRDAGAEPEEFATNGIENAIVAWTNWTETQTGRPKLELLLVPLDWEEPVVVELKDASTNPNVTNTNHMGADILPRFVRVEVDISDGEGDYPLNDEPCPFAQSGNSLEMPGLFAHLTPEREVKGTVEWRAKILYQRSPRNDLDEYPAGGGWVVRDARQDWDIAGEMDGALRGGRLDLLCRLGGAITTNSLWIRGINPDDADAAAYIDSVCGDYWFMAAIGRHESRQGDYLYNQFNETGTLGTNWDDVRYCPNRSSDMHGYGIFQVGDTSGFAITPDVLWNWQTNTAVALQVLDDAKNDAEAYFSKIEQIYPSQFEPPPSYQPPGTGTVLSALDAAAIQLFNGASVRKLLPIGNGSNDWFRSCWEFHPNNAAGNRWEFVPNRNNYVRSIVLEHESN